MQATRVRSLGAGVILALCLAPLAVGAEQHEAAEGERRPWDQEKLTELSGQLAEAISALRRSFRQEPAFRQAGSPNRRRTHEMEQIIRALQQSTRQLHNRIRGGDGFEETRNIARKIGSLLNDADVASRGIMTSAWVAERVRPAMVLINEIAPYYGSEPLYDPESLQRVDRPVNPDTPPAPEAPPAPE